jgi:catechol 2,3-dioxygenase-like lactoylglutathione lyase family enzyme
LAQRLANDEFDQVLVPEASTSVKPSLAVSRFLDELPDKASDAIFKLPDGRKAFVREVAKLETKSDNLQARQWMLKTEDGQTLYIKKLERPPRIEGTKSTPRTLNAKVDTKKKSARLRMKPKAVKLIVRSLERSRWFYHEVLGLKVDRESKTLVNFGGLISLVSREHETELGDPEREGFNTKSILCMECPNIEAAHDRVRSFIDAKAGAIQERAGRKVFRCFDLDGNLIEVFQAVSMKAPTPPIANQS